MRASAADTYVLNRHELLTGKFQTCYYTPPSFGHAKPGILTHDPFTTTERRAIAALAGIFWLRMFGLFLVLPVMAPYAEKLPGSTPLLVGATLGAYGLTQALFQIPFGLLSDRWGRKPMIAGGLLLFALGSMVAALADHIVWIVAGRALQGSGAIAAVILALTADLTRDQQRTKAMAVIGVSIGAAFFAALLSAPALTAWIGVPGLFWLTLLLALVAIMVLAVAVPTPLRSSRAREVTTVPGQIGAALRDRQLLRLDLGIFVLHFVLTAIFIAVPLALVRLGLPTAKHWHVYVPVLLASVLAMAPLIMLSTRRQWLPRIMVIGVSLLLAAQMLLSVTHRGLWGLAAALWVFFWGFNLLEATLPSLVSRLAPAARKGTALGVYNTFEFAGVFFGGIIGGAVYGAFGASGVFLLCAALLLPWLIWLWRGPQPVLLESRTVAVGNHPPANLADRLLAVPGVREVVVIAEEGVAYLKIDGDHLDEEMLKKSVAP